MRSGVTVQRNFPRNTVFFQAPGSSEAVFSSSGRSGSSGPFFLLAVYFFLFLQFLYQNKHFNGGAPTEAAGAPDFGKLLKDARLQKTLRDRGERLTDFIDLNRMRAIFNKYNRRKFGEGL